MLGSALKELRGFHRMTQKEVAGNLGISKSYLSEIENNHKTATLELLDKYSSLFEIPVSSLLLFSENYNTGKRSYDVRMACAKKIVRVMEWVNERDEFAKRKKAQTEDQD